MKLSNTRTIGKYEDFYTCKMPDRCRHCDMAFKPDTKILSKRNKRNPHRYCMPCAERLNLL